MAAKKIGHYITRPGKNLGDPPITFPVAEELETVPGIPVREEDLNFFSREDPLENISVNGERFLCQFPGDSRELL